MTMIKVYILLILTKYQFEDNLDFQKNLSIDSIL